MKLDYSKANQEIIYNGKNYQIVDREQYKKNIKAYSNRFEYGKWRWKGVMREWFDIYVWIGGYL